MTGIKINELLVLKVKQLENLVQKSWIAIDGYKRGPSNHKAFLTKEGKKIIQDRKKDFEFISLFKEPDAYVFRSQADDYQKLTSEKITRDINKIMLVVSNQLSGQPKVSNWIYYISKDIEFVKQTIGHRKLDTTSA